jgi:hypothetical protein
VGGNSNRDLRLAQEWIRGIPLTEICEHVGLSKSRVSTIAKQMGLSQRQPRPTPTDRNRFQSLYEQDLTVADTAARTGWHRDTVARSLRLAGIRIRSAAERARKWPIKHDAFSPPLSGEAWYWTGLLAADGHVSGASITLVQKNAERSGPTQVPQIRRVAGSAADPEST